MSKPTLKAAYTEPDEPKGHTGWAIDNPKFSHKELKKPDFKDALIEIKPEQQLKKRIAEINRRKKKVAKKPSFIQWLNKITKP